jgi:TatD DNase family protein
LEPRVYGGDGDVDAVISREKSAGVSRITTIGSGYGLAGAQAAVHVAERHENVWCTIGLHPHEARDWSEVRGLLVALAKHPKVVAFGEMGLDFHYDLSPRDVQRRVLREQVGVARSLGLPITIHDRDSNGETLDILETEGAFDGAGVLFHCYCGDVEMMQRIVNFGGYIAISGIVTFKNARVMREVARAVPAERVLVETDAPFLTPAPHRGQKNEPRFVTVVSDFVADLRGVDRVVFARLTAENACRFYGCSAAADPAGDRSMVE